MKSVLHNGKSMISKPKPGTKDYAMQHFSKEHFRSLGMRSSREIIVEKWLNEHGYRTEHGRTRLSIELDIYLPDQGIGFEFNGVAWHFSKSSHRVKRCNPKEIHYHYNKTYTCLINGIRLYHFWDYIPVTEVLRMVSIILNGGTLSDTELDLNPALITNAKLEPRYYITEDYGLYHKGVYKTKPMIWGAKGAPQIYEFYPSGFVL